MHSIRLYIISLLLLFLPALSLTAQTYSFDKYNVEDGLIQSNVVDLVQDAKGYVWIGTESGVSRFDGKHFTNYSIADGLADNNVSAMMIDNKGSIWFGHASGLITKYNGTSFEKVNTNNLFKDQKIYSMYQDMRGKVWVCVATGGVACLEHADSNFVDPANYKRYRGNNGLSEYVFYVTQTHDSTLWFLTDLGVRYWDKKQNKFEFFRPQGLPPLQITYMMEDKKGNYWFGTYAPNQAQALIYNPRSMKFTSVPTPAWVRTIKQDSNGQIWIASWGGGVVRYTDRSTDVFSTESGLSDKKVSSICEDREGNILFGTFGTGISIFKGERFITFSKQNGLLGNQVLSVCQDRAGKYYFGSNEGLTVYDLEEKKYTYFDKINGSTVGVKTIARDQNGYLWIGTVGKGVFRFDPNTGRFSNVSAIEAVSFPNTNIVNHIFVDKANCVWIATADGLVRYDQIYNVAHNFRTVEGLVSNDVSVVFEDSKKSVWVGCKGRGINKFNGTKFRTYAQDDGFTSNNPSAIAEDSDGKIWVGTEGGGVFVYDGKLFKNLRSKDGLTSDFITLIHVDDKNNVWIGTNKGLNKFESSSGKIYSYNKYDGFTALETKPNAGYKDSDGHVWFGTVNGVTRFDPKADRINNVDPITNITKVRVNSSYDLDLSSSNEIELSYKENSIRFEFVGVCVSNPDMVKYKVMLEGVDADYKQATNENFDYYSNLDPGKYVFFVKSCNNAGQWNETPTKIEFYIKPPFYKTWWFILLVIVGGIAAIVAYINVRERNLIREKNILEQKVEVRTAEVVQKNKELDEKNKDITASIRYAKRIQDAILPPAEFVEKYLPQTFILYKPKDIVSGDFYWVHNHTSAQNDSGKQVSLLEQERGDVVLFAAVDCTGHGVPGAFMSIVGHNLLDQIVGAHDIIQPAAILDALNKSVSDTLRQSYVEDQSVKDGMDITLCAFNRKTNVLEYAGAFNPLYFIREGKLTEIKGDKSPIGNLKVGEQKKFTNHSIQLQKGDTIYIFSDGFADQFGGPLGKKFKYKQLQDVLLSIQALDMEKQREALLKVFNDWKGDLEQVDDVLIIGTRL